MSMTIFEILLSNLLRKGPLRRWEEAMAYLREGGKKVAAAKTNVASFTPRSSRVSVVGYDNRKTGSFAPDITPLLWPHQDEVTRRFNLNDGGLLAQPVTDLNLPDLNLRRFWQLVQALSLLPEA